MSYDLYIGQGGSKRSTSRSQAASRMGPGMDMYTLCMLNKNEIHFQKLTKKHNIFHQKFY